MKIGVAVLGAGRWGVNLIRNFLEHPDSEFLAAIDPDRERLAAVQKQFDLNSEVILATDWSGVQGLPGLTAVAVATPASTHYTLAAAALTAGYHVFVEKPLALTLAEAIELCELAEKHQRQLFVDHTYLFHPAVAKGQTIIQQNRLGKLRYGYAQRTHFEPVRHDVDALWDLAVHDIAIFNTWLQQTPIQVTANGTVFVKEEARIKKQEGRGNNEEVSKKEAEEKRDKEEGKYDKDFESDRQVNYLQERELNSSEEIEHQVSASLLGINPLAEMADLVWITLTYPDGFQAFIHLCWLNPDKQRRLTVVGSAGTLIFDEMLRETPLSLLQEKSHSASPKSSFFTGAMAPQRSKNHQREVVNLELIEPLRQACDRFLECVRTNTPCSASSGEASVELIRILCTLSRSLAQGGKPLTIES